MEENNEYKDCPFCSEEIKLKATKCKHCKSVIVDIYQDQKPSKELMPCPECGDYIFLGAMKCKHCKAILKSYSQIRKEIPNRVRSTSSNNNKRMIPLIAIGLVALILIAFVAIHAIGQFDNQDIDNQVLTDDHMEAESNAVDVVQGIIQGSAVELESDAANGEFGGQPIILFVKDSLGNINRNSWAKGTGGGWSENKATPTLYVGDTITFAINAGGSPDLQYKFEYQPPGMSFITLRDWSSSNTYTWTVPKEAFGRGNTVNVQVRNNDGLNVFGFCDDYTYLIYNVDSHSSDSSAQPVILSASDSLGSINRNSWAKGTGGGWSDNKATPTLYVGDTITFTIDAGGSPDLLYKFEYQPPGMSFITLRDWSSSNTYTWTVPSSAFGRDMIVNVQVKNNDGFNVLGFCDDYTYLIYAVGKN